MTRRAHLLWFLAFEAWCFLLSSMAVYLIGHSLVNLWVRSLLFFIALIFGMDAANRAINHFGAMEETMRRFEDDPLSAVVILGLAMIAAVVLIVIFVHPCP